MPVGLSIGRVLEDLVSLKLCESGIALHRIVLYASTVVYLVKYEMSIVIQYSPLNQTSACFILPYELNTCCTKRAQDRNLI